MGLGERLRSGTVDPRLTGGGGCALSIDMPATPAWPPKSYPRLYLPGKISDGARIDLDGGQANYLGNVMRLGEGDPVLVFDGVTGEWLARIVECGKKRMAIAIESHVREAETVPDVWLAFAPVKRAQTDWLVEKATELGASRLLPLITSRTIVDRVKMDRLSSIAIEAAEQCGRTRLPDIDVPVKLAEFVKGQDGSRTIYFADEGGGAAPARAMGPGPAVLLVGPEGGFTDDERAMVRAAPGAVAISLGPRILRAETAALAALTAYMALAGDWR